MAWSSCVSHEHNSSTMCMPMASSSSTCITLSEGPESTDIDSEQAHQLKSASILNVLRATMPADISMEHTNVFDYSCFDSYNNICPLANR